MALKQLPPRLPAAPRTRAPFLDSAGGKNRDHYQSDEHRAWRYAVLRRDRFRCVKCGDHGPGVRLIADHIVEIEDGGPKLDVSNGQTLCASCSNQKTAHARRERQG